jgi:tetratricopeptide (TPR) repeat protein
MSDVVAARRYEAVSARLRQKGDAIQQRGDTPQAFQVYEDALEALESALIALGNKPESGPGSTADVPPDEVGKVADLYGARGGLLRRLNRVDEALQSYETGAAIERDFGLTATYNRTNAIKLALLSGASTLADAKPELADLQNVLEVRLRSDEQAADDAWLWADLADCRLLLGDESAAEDDYRRFVQKAERRSPVTALAVVRELATALTLRGDPDGARLAVALQRVAMALGVESTP